MYRMIKGTVLKKEKKDLIGKIQYGSHCCTAFVVVH